MHNVSRQPHGMSVYFSPGVRTMTSEAQKRATQKYDAANTTQFHLKLNNGTDADIIDRLNEIAGQPGGKQGYIKWLIRQDIKKGL